MRHVFITGCPRSGTTMLASILGKGNACIATPESDFFIDFIYKYLAEESATTTTVDLIDFLNNNYRFKQWGINAKDISNLPEKVDYSNYSAIIESALRLFAKKQVKIQEELIRIDHTPINIKHFNILNQLFPESKFIFIVRDPRAVYASVKGLGWGANTPLRLGEIWTEYILCLYAVQQLYPNRIYLIKYEDILNDAETHIKILCDFIEVPYSESLLGGKGFKVPHYSSKQHALVGKSLDKSRIEKWKNELNNEELLIIESHCKLAMKAFGYRCTQSKRYRITTKDKLKMLAGELFSFIPNKFRKKVREKKLKKTL